MVKSYKALPKISIITPTLNQAKFIERTILSVLNQGYPDLEYLVFDGGSTDGTQEILQRYSAKIKWWSEPDRGQSHALNKGLQICTGEIIGFINSDDEYEPGALLKVGQFFSLHPEAMWITGKCRIIDEDDKEVFSFISIYKHTLLRLHHPALLAIVDYIPQPSTFWRRVIVEEIGLFDESLRYVMDYDYWLRISKRYRLYYINEYLARFRIYPSSKTWQSVVSQDKEEEKMVQRYVKSKFLLFMHRSHRFMNKLGYSLLEKFVQS